MRMSLFIAGRHAPYSLGPWWSRQRKGNITHIIKFFTDLQSPIRYGSWCSFNYEVSSVKNSYFCFLCLRTVANSDLFNNRKHQKKIVFGRWSNFKNPKSAQKCHGFKEREIDHSHESLQSLLQQIPDVHCKDKMPKI